VQSVQEEKPVYLYDRDVNTLIVVEQLKQLVFFFVFLFRGKLGRRPFQRRRRQQFLVNFYNSAISNRLGYPGTLL
jgi:hypothetical protein